jgi:hypothetical protein
MAQLLFEDATRVGKVTHNQIQRLLLWCLDYLFAYGVLGLRNTFDPMREDLHARLYEVYQRTKVRSNWSDLFSFKVELAPGRVEAAMRKREEDRLKWKDVTTKMKIRKKDITKHGGLDDAAKELRVLGIWAGGLEGTIDDLFRDAIPPGLPRDPQLREK